MKIKSDNKYYDLVKKEIINRYNGGRKFFKARDLNLEISNRLIGRIIKYIAENEPDIELELVSPPNNNQSNRWFIERVKQV